MAVAVPHNGVPPFYRKLDLPVGAVLTDNGRQFCGTEKHPCEFYLELNGVEHRRKKVRTPKKQRLRGALQRHRAGRVLPGEAARDLLRQRRGLQDDLDAWLIHYNTERPHLGYRNMGRRPIETVGSFVSQED